MSTTPENLVNITSTSQFQELLSKDLNRVSLLNFWVPWAEQCTTMNQIVLELAKKYPTLLVLQVRRLILPTHFTFYHHSRCR